MGRLTRIAADSLGVARPSPDLVLGPRARLVHSAPGIRALTAAFPEADFTTSTISGFKGLQAPFVFLVDMNTGEFASRQDLWYVGATRATFGLHTFAKAAEGS